MARLVGINHVALEVDEVDAALDAPVMRVGAKDVLVGYEPTLERAILPQTDDISKACRTLLAY